MGGNGQEELKKAETVPVDVRNPTVVPDKSVVEATQGIRTNIHEKTDGSLLSKFPSVDEIPEGQAGLDWLIAHREEVYPWVKDEITFDNAGSPPGSRFYFEGVKVYNELRSHGYTKGKEIAKREQEARGEAAKLLGCNSEEIAFIQNTSHGINIVAQGLEGLDWKNGDEIVLCRKDKEYPSNYLPWEQLQKKLEKRGIKVNLVEVGDENGFISPEEIALKVTDRTRFVTLSSVGWKSGQRLNLEEIGKIVKNKGALLHVDAIQSVGAYDLDVKKSQIDFLSASGHKWMLAGKGNGIFYCKEDLIETLSEFAPQGADSLATFARDQKFDLRKDAKVFETGVVNEQGVCGLGEALKLINRVGINNIQNKILELSNYLRGDECHKKLEAKGYTIFGPGNNGNEKSGMVFITRPEWEAKEDKVELKKEIGEKVGAHLGKKVEGGMKPVWMSVRDCRLRAAIHYYNTKEEIDAMIDRLPDLGKAA